MLSTKLINKFNLKCTSLQAYILYDMNTKSWKLETTEFGKLPFVVKYQNVEGPGEQTNF